MPASEHVTIAVDEAHRVSGLLIAPTQSRACYIFAHGAGAGMSHSFMQSIATELGERGLASLRYQFPYMERGLKRVDPPKLAQATVRAAVERASRLLPDLPLLAGGKSFGGRMSSQAQADHLCLVSKDWSSSAFHSTPLGDHPKSGRSTWRMCTFRCCSCRGRAIRLPTPACSNLL